MKFQEDKKHSKIVPRVVLALVIILSALAFILIDAIVKGII